VTLIEYDYELRQGDEIVATGRFISERAYDIGDEVVIAGEPSVIVAVTPALHGSRPRLIANRAR
jgi:hypothetical protein